MIPEFFFDVADVEYIRDKWNIIKDYCNSKSVIGVTTNPGIWNKAGVKTFSDMNKRLLELSKLITEIRGDDKGVVYTQPPYSKMTTDEIEKFIELVKENTDGHTKIGCKLPPYVNILRNVDNWKIKYGIDFNVTGISDCSTALMSTSYHPKYISVIAGRMEEAGINAISQVYYIFHANLGKTEIITGAMRTIECLYWCCQYGTIPTIGTRIWDKILTEVGAEKFTDLWMPTTAISAMDFSPSVDKTMTDLSIAFFKQMDELGQGLYEGFKKLI